jgi:hypothetical protein
MRLFSEKLFDQCVDQSRYPAVLFLVQISPRWDPRLLFGHLNQIANLAQDVKLAACWFDGFVFHPCLVAGSNGQAGKFLDFLWEGCEEVTAQNRIS